MGHFACVPKAATQPAVDWNTLQLHQPQLPKLPPPAKLHKVTAPSNHKHKQSQAEPAKWIIAFDEELVSHVIGKGGQNIKAIRHEAHTEITILKQSDAGGQVWLGKNVPGFQELAPCTIRASGKAAANF